MSFLNSVLSAIGRDGPLSPSYPSTASASAPPSTRDISVSSKPQSSATNPVLKRKLDSEQDGELPRKHPSNPALTSKVNAAMSSAATTSISSKFSGATQPRTNIPPLAAAKLTSVAPKKGSYKEIMARAQAAKEAQAAIGQIKHKPVPKLTKKERLAQEAELAQKNKNAAKSVKSEARVSAKPDVDTSSKSTVKQPDSGYRGTMRPPQQENTYKGTMRPGGQINAGTQRSNHGIRKQHGAGSGAAREYTYASYSDEEDESAEEGYGTEESDDMEGGGFDELEREEEASLRAARREDEAARREEEAHYREKAARRKRLIELAAVAKAKKK